MAKTNIKEIARLANVSPAAVSIVINNKRVSAMKPVKNQRDY